LARSSDTRPLVPLTSSDTRFDDVSISAERVEMWVTLRATVDTPAEASCRLRETSRKVASCSSAAAAIAALMPLMSLTAPPILLITATLSPVAVQMFWIRWAMSSAASLVLRASALTS
jgi:hypothetical protein